jgi:hypothetical protein
MDIAEVGMFWASVRLRRTCEGGNGVIFDRICKEVSRWVWIDERTAGVAVRNPIGSFCFCFFGSNYRGSLCFC